MMSRKRAGIDRRAFIRRAAVGSAVASGVWMAPAIVRTEVSSAASTSCTTAEFNFSGFAVGTSGSPQTVAGVTLTVTGVDTGGNAVSPNFVVQNNLFGGATQSYWQMRQNATASSSDMTAMFGFSQALSGVCVSLLDVDRDVAAGWQDLITVTSTPAASITTTKSDPTLVSGTGTSGDPLIGMSASNVANGLTGGNVTIAFDGPITSFAVRYRNINETGSIQRLGIPRIEFCRP